ncbi:MAG: hypothetical protein QXI91_06975, partial [Candidatus Bathyarchaeia archaeon]
LKLAKDKIKKLGATSEETAKKPEELGIEERVLKILVSDWGVKRTSDGRYYVECEDEKHC